MESPDSKALIDFARSQIEDEIELDEILSKLKERGATEEEASQILQDASMNADLNKKEKEAIAEAEAKEEGSVWGIISIIVTVIVVIRLIMRLAG